jgi:hypothetical protein
MKSSSTGLAVLFILICMACVGMYAQEDEAPPLPPFVVVQQFFQFHFAHDMAFSEASVNAKQAWFTEDFYKKLIAELKKPVPKGEVPNTDGDPFTDSQEYPKSFKLIRSDVRGDRATVTVDFLWPDDKTTVQVALLRTAKGWLIDDILYDKEDSLRKLLK